MAAGQNAAAAKPMFNLPLRPATMPISHGIIKQPKLPAADMRENIEAPPRGKRSAVMPSIVGHKQLTAKPTAIHAANVTGGQGLKQAAIYSKTSRMQEANISLTGLSRLPIVAVRMRPRAIITRNPTRNMALTSLL